MQDLSVGVKAAIKHFTTRTALAKTLGITRAAVSLWTQVPIVHVLKIEEATGGALSRTDLRPDVYPPERPKAKRRAA
jgi:DNA-binding transcriptional regulator YdaS (Cro superfamily)